MVEQVSDELKSSGYEPRVVRFSVGPGVIFDLDVQHGGHKGKKLVIGLSFQELGYPEYPPHFVHVKSPAKLDRIRMHSSHRFEGEEWTCYSLPPSDFWDFLDQPQKNINTYVKRHLLRILAQA